MAEQGQPDAVGGEGDAGLAPASGTVSTAGAVSTTGGEVRQHTFHGRAVSWIAVVMIMIGFTVGGFGLVFGSRWWLFWTGAAVAALGGILAMATDIFADWY